MLSTEISNPEKVNSIRAISSKLSKNHANSMALLNKSSDQSLEKKAI